MKGRLQATLTDSLVVERISWRENKVVIRLSSGERLHVRLNQPFEVTFECESSNE